MKISKKIGVGLILLLVAAVSLFMWPNKTALAAVAPTDISNATYSFQDGGNIIGDFSTSGKVTFTDENVWDTTYNYVPTLGGFCDPGTISSQNGVPGNIRFGINLQLGGGVTLSSSQIPAYIKLGYLVGTSNCTGVLLKMNVGNPGTAATTKFEWNSSNITTLTGAQSQKTFVPAQNTSAPIYIAGSNACGATDAILLSQPGSNSGHYYQLTDIVATARGGLSANLPAELANTGAFKVSSCHVNSGPINVTIAGSQGQQAVGGPNSVSSTGDPNSSCEASSGSPLAWLMCPLFSAASAVVQSTINIFEGLLSFTVAQDLSNTSCSVNNQGCQDSVKLTWSILKNIASIVLVIIMLVMVFSQAISVGPFDAYTIRKMLPKLVAAVILMQLSWPLVAWIIDLFNDFGKGLQDLLYAPFGGSNTLNSLPNLIHHAGLSAAGTAAFNWVGILAVGVATLAALPTALFMAFAALMGLLAAIITLIFRKILIIMLLIFAPLALVAWILPGTQRYWKLWSDNLIKVLAMYPLVVAIIAVGRIFAYVAGPQTNVLLALLFVLVGFIGPLFILPRTFKWGGGIMSAAGGAINNVNSRLNKAAEEPIKGYARRQVQGRFAKKYRPKDAPGSTLFNRTANSLLGGRVIPTKYRSAILTQSGDKWNDERDAEALALLKRKGEAAMKDGYETAVLNDDKTGFAKYSRDAGGNLLDKSGGIAYARQADGTFKDLAGNTTSDFREAAKVDVATYDEADKRTLTGVAAMKQMWVDLADQSESSHERKMSIRQLTATSSWPEIQGNLSRAGNKVIDTRAWSESITTSPEDYPRILRSRVDATPHIDNWAQRQLAEAKTKDPARVWSRQEEKDFISQKRVLYSIRDQMSNEDFQTQSEGYWEEVARVANLRDSSGNLTEEAKSVQDSLRARFTAIHDIGGTAPQQLLGHLVGGSIQGLVDRALGPGANVREYVDTQTPLGGQTSTEAVSSRWETTIPTTIDLADPLTRAQYKTSLLSTVRTHAGVTPSPVGKALAEGLAYDVVSGPVKNDYINVLNEIRDSAAPSPEATAAYNSLVDEIRAAYDRRASEAVQAAVAEGRPAVDVATIKANAEAAAAADKATYIKI